MKYKIIIWMIVMFGLASSGLALSTSDYTTYYNFNVADISGGVMTDIANNNNNATLTGLTTEDGILHESSGFGNLDNFVVSDGDNGDFNLSNGEFFIYMWINNTADADASEGLMGKGSIFLPDYHWDIYSRKDSDCAATDWAFYDNTSVHCGNAQDMTDEQWHMLLVQRNSTGQFEMWTDGQLDTSWSNSVNLNAPGLIKIGYDAAAASVDYTGWMDEVGVGLTSFTQDEISRLYHHGIGFSPFATTTVDNTYFYYSMDNVDTNASHALDATTNNINSPYTGVTTGNSSCILNECYTFDGSGDRIEIVEGATGIFDNTTSSRSAFAWIFPTVCNGSHNILKEDDDTGRIQLRLNSSCHIEFSDRDGNQNIYGPIGTGKWHHVGFVWTQDEKALYINGSLVNVSTSIETLQTSVQGFDVGANPFDDLEVFIGSIDELAVYNRELLLPEIEALYNSGSGFNPFAAVADTINLSQPSPPDQSQFNTNQLHFNVSVNASRTFNASFYVGDVLNQTKTGFGSGTDVFVDFNLTFAAEDFETILYKISIQDNASVVNTSGNTVYLDNVNPIITANFTNLTAVFQNNLTGEFTFTDSFSLFSYNISVDGVEIDSLDNILNTSVTYELNYDASSLSPGEHILTTRVADGHTATRLGGDYDVSNGLFNDYIKYEFYDGGWAKVEGLPGSIWDTFTSDREVDRYTFTYEPNDIQENYSFEVTSDYKINIIDKPDSVYQKWLVMGNHWLDFYLEDEDVTIDITRIDDYTVTVDVKGLKFPWLQQYSSIGDLNIVTNNYTFSVTNATLTFQDPVTSLTSQTIEFAINTTALITETDAQLTWNGTNQSLTKTQFSNYDLYSSTFVTPSFNQSVNVSFFWNYTIFGAGSNETGSINETQQINFVGLDNCSTFGDEALNFSMIFENDNQPIVSNLDGYFLLWTSDINNNTKFNLTWTGGSSFAMCIFPPDQSYNVYAQLEYQNASQSLARKTYYLTNLSISNQTTFVNLYLTDGTTQTQFIVRDEDDNPVQDVLIKVLSYELETDSSRLTEIVNTGSDGIAYAQIILDEQFYKFILERNGVVIFESTGETKIVSATGNTFRVTLGEDFFTNYQKINDVSTSLIFDNSTNEFTYTFTDNTGALTIGCLKVYEKTSVADTIINGSCVAASSGSISLGIGADPGNSTFVGKGLLTIGSDSVVAETEVIKLGGLHQIFGKFGVMLSFMIIITLGFIGAFRPEVAVILTVLGLITVNIIGIFYLNWSLVIALILAAGLALYKMSRN